MNVFGIDNFFGTTKAREGIATLVFTLFVIIPTIEYCGFLFERTFDYDEKMVCIIASGGSLVSLFIANNKRIVANLITAPIFGYGVVYATIWYLSERESILRIEIIVPLILGAAPGLAVYSLFVRFAYKPVPKS